MKRPGPQFLNPAAAVCHCVALVTYRCLNHQTQYPSPRCRLVSQSTSGMRRHRCAGTMIYLFRELRRFTPDDLPAHRRHRKKTASTYWCLFFWATRLVVSAARPFCSSDLEAAFFTWAAMKKSLVDWFVDSSTAATEMGCSV